MRGGTRRGIRSFRPVAFREPDNLQTGLPVFFGVAATVFISEIFESIQGEGPFAETPSLFIRTSGCNLRCSFCDTPYTSWDPEGQEQPLESLGETVRNSSCQHVVLTGGEPMLAPRLAELSDICRAADKTITIETAGTVDRSLECDLMAISPKMKNSVPTDNVWAERHEQTRHQPAVIESLIARYNCILKFVIDSSHDVREVVEYLQQFPQVRKDQVWLMPQARSADELRSKSATVQAACSEHGFKYSSRLHIERYGNARGV